MITKRYYGGVRRAVEREGAQRYLLVTLISFAASVALTRLFLELTGYPQLGNEELHIAHVLWGGLLLFIAALLPLIFANRWAYTWGALLAGLGVGLFIDEVGKFITQSNDYFYPAAAPLIYALFLLTVLIYVQIRRSHMRSPRAELYRALDGLQEVLDHDLDPQERHELEARLRNVEEHADQPSIKSLARELLDFIRSKDLTLVPDVATFWERLAVWAQGLEARWIPLRRLKAVLVGGLAGLGVVQILGMVRLVWAALDPAYLDRLLGYLLAAGKISDASALAWFGGRMALEGAGGLMLIGAALFLVFGKERVGIRLAYYGLLVTLTITNLLVFYFEQFSTIITASIQLVMLLGVLRYQSRRFVSASNVLQSEQAGAT